MGNKQWVIGHRDASGWLDDTAINDANIKPGADYNLKLMLQGSQATLPVGGVTKSPHLRPDFRGSVGLGTQNSVTQFDNLSVLQASPRVYRKSAACGACPTKPVPGSDIRTG